MMRRNRRSFVAGVATVGMVGTAGCLSTVREFGTDDSRTTTDESNGSKTGGSSETVNERTAAVADLPGEPISTFEDLDQWVSMYDRGELEAVEGPHYAGRQSARLSAGADVEYAGTYATFPDGLDLREKTLSLAARFDGLDQVTLSVELYAPNARNGLRLRRTLTGPTDRWVRVDFGAVQTTGAPDLGDVREIRVTAHRRGGETGPIECLIDDLRAVEAPERGSVLFLFDATLESHYTHAVERMDAYGFAGVEAVIPETVGETGRLTLDQLGELADAGWDLAARPRTGARNLPEFGQAEQERLIRWTKAYLEDRGFGGAEAFVVPRDFLGPETIDLVREHHDVAFRYGGGPNGLPTTDPHNLGVISGHAGEETMQYVDLAADYGHLTVCHVEHVGEDGIDVDDFDSLLEHVAQADVDVVTATDLG